MYGGICLTRGENEAIVAEKQHHPRSGTLCRRGLKMVPAAALLALLILGCDRPDSGGNPCMRHADCEADHLCRDHACLPVASEENLCIDDWDCPADSYCHKAVCLPVQEEPADGDPDAFDQEGDTSDQ